MKSYVFSSLDEADRVLTAMREFIDKHGHITVDNLNQLIGLPSTFVDSKNGWFNTNHLLQAGANNVPDSVTLELPDPVAIDPRPRNLGRLGTLRLTMEFDATETMDQRLTEFLCSTPLLRDAKSWSLTKRPSVFPRVSYHSSVNSGDDI